MGDVGRLVSEDLLGQVFEDGSEVVGNGEFLDISAGHNKIMDSIAIENTLRRVDSKLIDALDE